MQQSADLFAASNKWRDKKRPRLAARDVGQAMLSLGVLTAIIGSKLSFVKDFAQMDAPGTEKKRVIAYIDGFNLYFGLKDKGWQRYYWLDVTRLAENILEPNSVLMGVKYFTARVTSLKTSANAEPVSRSLTSHCQSPHLLRKVPIRDFLLPELLPRGAHTERKDDRRQHCC